MVQPEIKPADLSRAGMGNPGLLQLDHEGQPELAIASAHDGDGFHLVRQRATADVISDGNRLRTAPTEGEAQLADFRIVALQQLAAIAHRQCEATVVFDTPESRLPFSQNPIFSEAPRALPFVRLRFARFKFFEERLIRLIYSVPDVLHRL